MANKATPARIKIARGSFRSNRNTFAEENFKKLDYIPEPPIFCKKHPQLKELWFKICQNLLDIDLLYEPSLHILDRWIKFQYVFDKSFDTILDEGLIIANTRGELKSHPAFKNMVTANDKLLELEKLMFITPSHMPHAPVSNKTGSTPGINPSDVFNLET